MVSKMSGMLQGLKNSSALPNLPPLSLSLGAREGKICVCGYVMTTSIFLVTPSFRKQSMETISKGKGNL